MAILTNYWKKKEIILPEIEDDSQEEGVCMRERMRKDEGMRKKEREREREKCERNRTAVGIE